MSKNSFDDEWDIPTDSSLRNEEENISSEIPPKSLSLRLKINPKISIILSGSIVLLIILANFISNFYDKADPALIANSKPSASAAAEEVSADLYSQPKLLQLFIDNSLASSVTIFCGNSSGSGWAIDLSDDLSSSRDDSYPTEIITNHHVIDGCENSRVTIVPMGTESSYDAYVYSHDRSNDLAVLMTGKYLPPFSTVQPGNEPKVGQWVMAVGSPGAGDSTLDGSVTTGTITNLRDGVVITDTTINPGNSGGPLLNAAGQVIAVVSAKVVQENVDSIGIAIDVALICEQLNACSNKRLLK